MTLVINLLGGSGLGKSTVASLLYGTLKELHHDVELVREYVKEWVLEGKQLDEWSQYIIFGSQLAREVKLYNKVDIIVTDSPLYLPCIYDVYTNKKSLLIPSTLDFFKTSRENGITHINFLLERQTSFESKGRYETEDQAIIIDSLIKEFLLSHNIDFIEVKTPLNQRVNFILDYLRMIGKI